MHLIAPLNYYTGVPHKDTNVQGDLEHQLQQDTKAQNDSAPRGQNTLSNLLWERVTEVHMIFTRLSLWLIWGYLSKVELFPLPLSSHNEPKARIP